MVVAAQASLAMAQQYGPGPVLDPNQRGNLDLIFEREQIYYDNQVRRRVAEQPQSWNDLALREFRAGNYTIAAIDWRHALVDEPRNGTFALRLAQAEFARGNFTNAADALHLGMSLTPQRQWGDFVKNYKRFYGQRGAFAAQLKALEATRKENPDDPAVRFVLGFQYLYLGYPEQAATQLSVATRLSPDNVFVRELAAVATGLGGVSEVETLSAAEPEATAPVENDPAVSDPPPSRP
jgi:tetratricopeptide (TPR) repeat protein